ncbi:hypothetical protein FJSC11DRAFT_3467 [Fischerella thermalis JSC-11]|uniref:Uncharacterized protein n=1 Tax=Fischerella thermalis JSC-11 TaxID=741277 RepID=G6FX68_9CYAN|nr:hypothetical protein FJSC11DRAFT_3467 [Fischerella thermalis JSC-11]
MSSEFGLREQNLSVSIALHGVRFLKLIILLIQSPPHINPQSPIHIF